MTAHRATSIIMVPLYHMKRFLPMATRQNTWLKVFRKEIVKSSVALYSVKRCMGALYIDSILHTFRDSILLLLSTRGLLLCPIVVVLTSTTSYLCSCR